MSHSTSQICPHSVFCNNIDTENLSTATSQPPLCLNVSQHTTNLFQQKGLSSFNSFVQCQSQFCEMFRDIGLRGGRTLLDLKWKDTTRIFTFVVRSMQQSPADLVYPGARCGNVVASHTHKSCSLFTFILCIFASLPVARLRRDCWSVQRGGACVDSRCRSSRWRLAQSLHSLRAQQW